MSSVSKRKRIADIQKKIDKANALLPDMKNRAGGGSLVYVLSLKSMESHIEELKSELLSLKEQS